MMLLSLAEVAARTGMARSSIYRLIDEGKLSATIDHRGRKSIELTEALRVFGSLTEKEKNRENNTPDKSNNKVIRTRHTEATGQDTVSALIQELAQARAELQFKAKELDLKDRELALMQSRVEELKTTHEQTVSEKNRFLEIIERQSLLLAAPKPARPRTSTPAKKTTTARAAATPKKTTTAKAKPTASASPKVSQSATPKTKAKATPKAIKSTKASKASASKSMKKRS